MASPTDLVAIAPAGGQGRQGIASLPILVIHAHSSCNCRCVMCDIWKTRESHTFTPAQLRPHLESIRRLGVRWVVFSGGEPLLNEHLPELCAMLRREGIRLTLLTTGLLLEKKASEVVESFDDAIVSLDGPEPVHDSVRRVRGAFALIRSGINAARGWQPAFRLSVRTTIQRANHRHLRETVAAAKLLGVNGISFLAADLTSEAFNRPEPWSPERQNEVALNLEEVAALHTEIEALLRENHSDIASGYVAESPGKLRRIARHFRAHLGLEQHEAPHCNAPWVSAVIEADGTARPCFFHRAIGNLNRGTLDGVLNGSEALAFRSTLDVASNPTCKRCVCSLNYGADAAR